MQITSAYLQNGGVKLAGDAIQAASVTPLTGRMADCSSEAAEPEDLGFGRQGNLIKLGRRSGRSAGHRSRLCSGLLPAQFITLRAAGGVSSIASSGLAAQAAAQSPPPSPHNVLPTLRGRCDNVVLRSHPPPDPSK